MNTPRNPPFKTVAKSVLLFALLGWPILGMAAVQVVSATYGANCGAARDNVKSTLVAACDGRSRCEYIVDYQVIGDPAPGCAKTFEAAWTCTAGGQQRTAKIPAEAGFKSRVVLSCGVPVGAATPAPPVVISPTEPPVVMPAPPPSPSAPALAVSAPDGSHLMSVYFATDRKRTGIADPAKRFGGDRGEVSYGVCSVSVPTSHEMGELESPSWWKFEFSPDPEKHVVLLEISPMSRNQLLAAIAEKVGSTSAKSAFVFVHGYNVTFEDAARRTAQMAYDLNFQGAPIFYSWPSQARVMDYVKDEQNVEWTQPHLEIFLQDLVARTDAQNIYLVAHSMGNRALTRAFAQLVTDKPELAARVKELILTAPDIDADVFKTQIAPKLVKLGTPVTLYASATDQALEVSREVHGAPRAGDAGNALVILTGMETIDASQVDSSMIGHSYYAENRSVIADIFYVLKDHRRAQDRFGLREVVTPQGRYWVFRQ